MAMNFQALMQMKTLWQRLQTIIQFPAFLRACSRKSGRAASFLFPVKNPEGKVIESNLGDGIGYRADRGI